MEDIKLPDEWINPSNVLPEEDVELVGIDGNAGSVMGFVSRALKQAGNSTAVVDAWRREAMSGDYNHLLRAAMEYLGY